MKRATTVFALLSATLAILAGTIDAGAWAEKTLWFGALFAATLALITGYGIAITWARRRKRLWG